MKKKVWVKSSFAALVVVGLMLGTWRRLTTAVLRHFTEPTTKTLATSPSGLRALVEEAANHGAYRSYRHLRLESGGADPVAIAAADWSMRFTAKWTDDSHVEVIVTR